MTAYILLGLAAFLGLLLLIRRLSRSRREASRPYRLEGGPRRVMMMAAGSTGDAPIRPASLRPVINENRCIGCGSCIEACPEDNVIGIDDFETRVVNPDRCLGHGACITVCPMDAITLMAGTAVRGIDLPVLKPNFATRIPGLYVAGELGGMGLMQNAVEQGRQALESIRRLKGIGEGDGLDVVIIGAGPAGLSASLAAKRHTLRYATLEQGDLEDALLHYPRRHVVLAAPVKLLGLGETGPDGIGKEALPELWRSIIRDADLGIRYQERVDAIIRNGNGFSVRSSKAEYQTRAVLLATGRGGTPRKLGVPGETLAKVVYRLVNPEQYRDRQVLVVGGGDAAIETAIAIALEQPASITLVHRGNAFSRCGEYNRERIAEFERAGRVRVMLQAQVRRITEASVEIQGVADTVELPNDDIVICTGGIASTELLKSLGLMADSPADQL